MNAGSIGTRVAEFRQSLHVEGGTAIGKAAEDDVADRRRRRERINSGCNRDPRRTVGGETIDAGGNRGKSNRDKAVDFAQFDRAAIAGRQRQIFGAVAAVPDRADRMDHMPGRQPVGFSDLGAAGLAAPQRTAFGQKLGAGGTMDRAVDATPSQQRRICGVDDGVNAQAGDVGDDDFQPRRADLARRQAQAAGAESVTPLSANSCCSSPAWNISRMISQPPTNSPLT
jgi:hypothetical protein